jgi:hypothetical protein
LEIGAALVDLPQMRKRVPGGRAPVLGFKELKHENSHSKSNRSIVDIHRNSLFFNM